MPGSIAPLSMAWQRRMGSNAGPLSSSGEASNGNPVQIEMYLSGAWVDITSYVMVRDESGNISITRGRRDEGSTTEQQTLAMTLNNRDGRWSPRYPSGPYYGVIGRNTPVRVSVPNGLGGKSYRFQGEISTWPQGWDPTGTDVYTEVEGAGIIRRLSQGPVPAYSLIRTALTNPISANLRAYWPMEDPADSTSFSSPLTNCPAMTFTGTPTFADYTGFPSSDPAPTLASTILTGGVAKYPTPTSTQVRFFLSVPPDGFLQNTVICSISQEDQLLTSWWELRYGDSSLIPAPNTFSLWNFDGDSAAHGAILYSDYDIRGKNLYVSVELQTNGGNHNRSIKILNINDLSTHNVSDTLGYGPLTRVLAVRFGATNPASAAYSSTGISACSVGHVTVEDVITPLTALGVYLNPIGETAGNRIQRICDTNAIAFESVGDLTDTVAMGNQTRLNALDQMQECELADDGMLYESMPTIGIGYRTRASLLNQDPQLTLNYTGFNLSEVPTPVEDDRYIQNQVTVTVSGVSQTYALTTGDLSTQYPPAGVGPYGTEITLNLQSTGDALSQAAWRVHLGTVDEPRYPEISVNLAHSTFVNNPALKQAVLGLRQGDRIIIQNPPFWLPPGSIDQLILGFSETITNFEHRVTFVCAPASPYTVGFLDNAYARIDTDGSALAADATSGATTFTVSPTSSSYALWTTDPADFPFDVRVGGEQVTVTNITGTTAPQTFTVTRSVNGIVKAQTAGTDIRLATPTIISL